LLLFFSGGTGSGLGFFFLLSLNDWGIDQLFRMMFNLLDGILSSGISNQTSGDGTKTMSMMVFVE
jgi:hypothetical protein